MKVMTVFLLLENREEQLIPDEVNVTEVCLYDPGKCLTVCTIIVLRVWFLFPFVTVSSCSELQ